MSCSLPRFEDPDDLFDAAFAIVIWLVCCMTAARSLCDADVSLLVRQGGLHRLMLEVDAVLVSLVVVGADHLGASDDATTANTTADPRCFKVWTTPKRPPDNNHPPGRRTGRWKWKKIPPPQTRNDMDVDEKTRLFQVGVVVF